MEASSRVIVSGVKRPSVGYQYAGLALQRAAEHDHPVVSSLKAACLVASLSFELSPQSLERDSLWQQLQCKASVL